MKRWLFPFLLIIILMVPTQVSLGQGGTSFATVEVDLWPEYDSPEMLVIYRIELSPNLILPVDISIQIPAAAGPPNAVAVRDPNGALLNAPYERSVDGDWASISLTASMSEIQIEYYDPQLNMSNAEREYVFTWMGDYSTGSMLIQFQQPYDALQVEIFPQAASSITGPDGLTYHTIDLGPQSQGVTTSVSIGYSKDSNALTIEQFQVQPNAPISGDTSGRVNLMDILPWALGLLGFILIGGGIWWYFQAGQEKPRSSRRSRSRGQRSAQSHPPRIISTSTHPGDPGVYCHQCGKRAEAGDRFCRTCGTKLRAA